MSAKILPLRLATAESGGGVRLQVREVVSLDKALAIARLLKEKKAIKALEAAMETPGASINFSKAQKQELR